MRGLERERIVCGYRLLFDCQFSNLKNGLVIVAAVRSEPEWKSFNYRKLILAVNRICCQFRIVTVRATSTSSTTTTAKGATTAKLTTVVTPTQTT